MISKIKGVVKEYDWGSYDALPSIFGYDVENKPQAEAWFGTHPNGCAIIENGLSLKQLLQDDPEKLLGDYCYNKYGAELPILLKILAVRSPLSIQCHPSEEIARAGFEAETARREAGTPVSELDFKDPNKKAELFFALSPVTALYGFRSLCDIQQDLKRVIPYFYKGLLQDDDSIEKLFCHILSLSKEERKRCLEELVSNMVFEKEASDPRFLGHREIVQRNYKLFDNDIGLLIVYMLNLAWLEKGEAIYLSPCTVHTYIFGNGIELMNLSDNCFRAGLTVKRINTKALMEIMDSRPSDVHICRVVREKFNRDEVVTPNDDFTLYHLEGGSYEIKEKKPSLLLTIDKGAVIKGRKTELSLSQGECCFISADEDEYTIEVAGEAFQAAVRQEELN